VAADTDARWLAAAASLAERSRPLSRPNPAVGVVVVRDGLVVGRGWTHPGGRPHAEAAALAEAGEAARGAVLYVTLEPCAHRSERGPACADLASAAGLARAVIGVGDPDPRTAGQGARRLEQAGLPVAITNDPTCRRSLEGYLKRTVEGRPHVTLKLALTADQFIARGDGTSRWITGEAARAHVHRQRARADAILVGGGTLRIDAPRLDVRLPGLDARSPERLVLTREAAPHGWTAIPAPAAIAGRGWQYLFVEGGAGTAAAFLDAGLVDRVLLYRSPTRFGAGIVGLRKGALDSWRIADRRMLGSDTLEVYEPA
jgi:diaminohydroxyphosphoribosylaminopyrimidine deaminase/5-amino-6-(5-phosphoribosylamino)uracil reductase